MTSSSRPSFATVCAVGLSFLPRALRWLGIAAADADDMLQEVLLAAHNGLARFEPRRAAEDDDAAGSAAGGAPHDQGTDDAAIRRWLFGIARRKASHYHAQARRRPEIPSGAGPSWSLDPFDPAPTPEEQTFDTEVQRLVTSLLQKIPTSRRVVLIMYDLLDIPIPDIARELRLNENTVRSRLRIAREDFKAAALRDAMARERKSLFNRTSEIQARMSPMALLRLARHLPAIPAEAHRTLWARLERLLQAEPRSQTGIGAAAAPETGRPVAPPAREAACSP